MPEVVFDDRKRRTFDELWESTLQQGQGSRVDYRCDYPKHEFLTYLVERKGFLLHGSNFPDIKTLIPIRITKDTTSYGNHEAVYACADGVWAIWFAIVNRNLHKTSWLSSCRSVPQAATTKKFYFFSVNQQVPKAERWTEGMVYVLPRDSFNQLSDDAGCLVEEWASAERVIGLAKLPVGAHDFPSTVVCSRMMTNGSHSSKEALSLTQGFTTCMSVAIRPRPVWFSKLPETATASASRLPVIRRA